MKKQISAFFILLLMSIYLLSGCESPKINQKKQEQKTMGRYTERDVDTPSGGSWQKMFALKDGGYALYEEGKSPVLITADGSVRQVSNLWRNTAGITVETNCAVSMDGDMVLAYLPILSEKEYEELGDKIAPNAYLYVDSSGDKRALQPYGEGFSEDMWPDNMAFAPDGWLYISDSYGKVFRMNTESGEMYFLFQAENSIQEFCFYENIMLALDNAKAWLYDMSEEELLEGNPILDEFVVSHQSNGKSIALAVGREDGNVLYLGCSTGLYRYVWDGSLIEQMADGQLLPFGDSSLKLQSMQCLEKEEFRVFFQTNHMVELYFDETLPAKPDRTLHVYSLEENQRIRYASQLFQKEHADVFVRYETGIDGDNAVSREDAQRKLNTELLAGDGPDLMVLDGLDIEQYASKGVLKELDDVLRPYIEDKLLFENMVEGMRMTEDKAVYALPMTVWLPCWLSERKYLEGQENLWDIVDGLKKAREEHPTGALLALRSEEDLLKELIFTSLPAWTKEDGSLDTEMLQDFFEAALCLWELNAQGMTEEDWKLLQTELSEKEGYRYPSFMCAAASGIFERWGDEHIWVQLGHIYNPGHCLSSLHFYSNTSMKEWMKADKGNGEELDIWWDTYHGQAKNVFVGHTIVGICEKAKEPELAEEFLKLLLSDSMMEKWWLKVGFPISRHGVETCLDMENTEYGQYLGFSESYVKSWMNNDIAWPNEEEQKHFWDMIESAAVFYQSGSTLEEIATDIGIQVLKGELTPEQGAKEVQKKMAIEMQE